MKRRGARRRLLARSSSRESNSAPTLAGASSGGVPELPETETIARDLNREIARARVISVTVRKADVLRDVSAKELRKRVTGSSIVRAWRRAKLVVLDLSSDDRIVVQP